MQVIDRPTQNAIPDEALRIAALRRTGLLDHACDATFDRLTRLLARLLGAPVALLTLVDAERHFFLGQHGLPDPWASRREGPLTHSFCRQAVTGGAELVVDDATIDPRVRDHPAIAALGIAAYAGLPVATPDGQPIGMLCAVDRVRRAWSPQDLATLADLAALATGEIALRCRLVERAEVEERLTLAVAEIDHRVKNSLTVIRSLLEMQARAGADADMRDQLQEAAMRVATVAHVHDRLYRSEASGAVELSAYLRGLCEDLCRALGIAPSARRIDVAAARLMVPADRAVSLGLVVAQLVGRAARAGGDGVQVSFTAQPGERYLLTVGSADRDDPVEAAAARGLGTRLVAVLTRQLEGEIAMPGDGSVRITLPAAALS